MVAMPVVLQFLWAFPLWLSSLQEVASCLQCDPHFLKSLTTLLTEILPQDLPDRDTLITRHVQALANIHGTFLQRKYERVLDVRGVMAIKSDIISQLRAIKKNTWKGVFLWQFSMYHLRVNLRKKMQQTLEKFADLGTNPEGYPRRELIDAATRTGVDLMQVLRSAACSEDCTIVEGPVLDCWTCLRIVAQCFDGDLCGVEDRRLAEYNEVVLYVFMVCESVVTTSIILVYLVCFKHRKRMLLKSLGY